MGEDDGRIGEKGENLASSLLHPCPLLNRSTLFCWWLTGLEREVYSHWSHPSGIQALVVLG